MLWDGLLELLRAILHQRLDSGHPCLKEGQSSKEHWTVQVYETPLPSGTGSGYIPIEQA